MKNFWLILLLALGIIGLTQTLFGQNASGTRDRIAQKPCANKTDGVLSVTDGVSLVTDGATAVATAENARLFVEDDCGELKGFDIDSSFGSSTRVFIEPNEVARVYSALLPQSNGEYGIISLKDGDGYILYSNQGVVGFRFVGRHSNLGDGYVRFREPFYPRLGKQYRVEFLIGSKMVGTKKMSFHFQIDPSGQVRIAL